NLWDCGGQDAFMEKHFESQREQIFKNVEVLIYVFDINSTDDKDIANFQRCINAIEENSKDARIFCLIDKTDLIRQDDLRVQVFNQRAKHLARIAPHLQIMCFGTSICDETLY